MSSKNDKERVAISVAEKLRNAARSIKDMNPQLASEFVNSRYVYERMMARLRKTELAERWALKGGVLMLALPQQSHRMTLDIDLSDVVEQGQEREQISVTEALKALCATDPEDEDGIQFDLVTDGKDALRMLREESQNPTIRGKLIATLKLPRPNERRFIIDITPSELSYSPQLLEWQPTLKGFETFKVKAYPWELALAEKLHSVMTGSRETPRLRDYMDVIAIKRAGVVDVEVAAFWLSEVFKVRNDEDKFDLNGVGLTQEFAKLRQKDWSGTLIRTGYAGKMPDLFSEAIVEVSEFADLILAATPNLDQGRNPGLTR